MVVRNHSTANASNSAICGIARVGAKRAIRRLKNVGKHKRTLSVGHLLTPECAVVAQPCIEAIAGTALDDKSTMNPESDPRTSAPVAERRRNQRIEVALPVAGELLALHAGVTLVNISRGGCLVQGDTSLSVGVTYAFRFTPAGAAPTTVSVRITHILRITRDGAAEYAMGGEFVDTPAAEIDRLLHICEER
jgi:hypothetical protein